MADEGHRNDATPQDVRAVLRELSANQRETDRHMLDTERQMQEAARRLRQTEELFVTQWDKLIEALAKRDLIVLLNRRGIQVDHVSTNLERNYRGRRWDIDILSVNSDELVAVQVRTTLNVYDVDDFLDTLRHIDELMPEYAARVAYGAVAYLKANESADAYAERQGLFVIRATGSSASITNGKDFRPRTPSEVLIREDRDGGHRF